MKANRKFVEEKEAVSAVIGVILMVAITVAIAATVYLYVSGFFGGGLSNTPTVGLSAEPSGTVCTINVGSPTASDIDWGDVEYTWVALGNATEMPQSSTTLAGTTGDILKAGEVIQLVGCEDDEEYRFTISYEPTGGQLGTCSWTQ